jgi:phage terminase large subunit GpA-like protein
MTIPFAGLCPHCGQEIQSAIAAQENIHRGDVPDGAVTICWHCGQFSILDRGMLRRPRHAESQRIARDEICATAQAMWFEANAPRQ